MELFAGVTVNQCLLICTTLSLQHRLSLACRVCLLVLCQSRTQNRLSAYSFNPHNPGICFGGTVIVCTYAHAASHAFNALPPKRLPCNADRGMTGAPHKQKVLLRREQGLLLAWLSRTWTWHFRAGLGQRSLACIRQAGTVLLHPLPMRLQTNTCAVLYRVTKPCTRQEHSRCLRKSAGKL